MNNDLTRSKNKPTGEPIVITDECGDSMWDAVLDQEAKTCDVKEVSNNASSLLNAINTIHKFDVTKER